MKRVGVVLLALALVSALGCGGGGETKASPTLSPPVKLTGDLDMDIRYSAHVELDVTGTNLDASVTLSNGLDVAPVGQRLQGKGHVEAFLEADATLYTATFAAPASPAGPCAAQPVTLALSLHRQGKNKHVGGALTAYCGAGVTHGVPANLMRLAGDMPP